jgi:hypothetical protein
MVPVHEDEAMTNRNGVGTSDVWTSFASGIIRTRAWRAFVNIKGQHWPIKDARHILRDQQTPKVRLGQVSLAKAFDTVEVVHETASDVPAVECEHGPFLRAE